VEDTGERPTAGASVGFQIHDFAKQMGVHREHGTEQEREPWHLGDMAQPTREDEDEQVTRLVQQVEPGASFERERPTIVDRGGNDQRGVPVCRAPQTGTFLCAG